MRARAWSIGLGARFAPIVATAVATLTFYRVVTYCAGPSIDRALALFRRWCRWVWPRLRLAVRVDGRTSPVPCIYLANHRSYLDIPVLGGALGAAFLSRADVAAWPVIGRSATAIGVIFIDRGDPLSGARAARAMARRVRSHSLIVFPEGTTGGERLPQPFAAGLFRLLARLHVPIVPVTVRYSDRRAYWVDERPLVDHLAACVAAPDRMTAVVHVGSVLEPQGRGASPDELAARAYQALCAPIEAFGELVDAREQAQGPTEAPGHVHVD